jgi:DNA invertase Pin-like site-specific DNA recombinase
LILDLRDWKKFYVRPIEFTEVESGKRNARPELQKALAACRRHKAKLCIAKLDRLRRASTRRSAASK